MPKHSDLFKSLAFLSFLLANLWFLTPVHAQVGGCFERFFAEGKELLAEKNFEMARKQFPAHSFYLGTHSIIVPILSTPPDANM